MSRSPHVGKKKVRPPKRPDLMQYIGPPGARVALLRSPVLPPAGVVVPDLPRGVHHPIIRGVNPSADTGHFYPAELPDISIRL